MDEEPLCGSATANSHLFIYLFIYYFSYFRNITERQLVSFNVTVGVYKIYTLKQELNLIDFFSHKSGQGKLKSVFGCCLKDKFKLFISPYHLPPPPPPPLHPIVSVAKQNTPLYSSQTTTDPSLHLSVHLSFFFISCFYTRVLQCLKLLFTGKEYQSLWKEICFRPHYI